MKKTLFFISTMLLLQSYSNASDLHHGDAAPHADTIERDKRFRKDIKTIVNDQGKLVAIPVITTREFNTLVNDRFYAGQNLSTADDFNRVHDFVADLTRASLLVSKHGVIASATSIDVVTALDFLRSNTGDFPRAQDLSFTLQEYSELDEISFSFMVFVFFGGKPYVEMISVQHFIRYLREYFVVVRFDHGAVKTVEISDVIAVINRFAEHYNDYLAQQIDVGPRSYAPIGDSDRSLFRRSDSVNF